MTPSADTGEDRNNSKDLKSQSENFNPIEPVVPSQNRDEKRNGIEPVQQSEKETGTRRSGSEESKLTGAESTSTSEKEPASKKTNVEDMKGYSSTGSPNDNSRESSSDTGAKRDSSNSSEIVTKGDGGIDSQNTGKDAVNSNKVSPKDRSTNTETGTIINSPENRNQKPTEQSVGSKSSIDSKSNNSQEGNTKEKSSGYNGRNQSDTGTKRKIKLNGKEID